MSQNTGPVQTPQGRRQSFRDSNATAMVRAKHNATYHKLFAALIFVAGALELATLLRRREGETMSSYVMAKVKHPAMRVGLGGLLGWLFYHWLRSDGSQLGIWDAVATLAGLLGAAAVMVRTRSRPSI